jgi:hypothetical protein
MKRSLESLFLGGAEAAAILSKTWKSKSTTVLVSLFLQEM